RRPVSGVADKLHVREALVADVAEQPQADILDLGLAPRLEDGAGPEPERPLANLAAGHAGERFSAAADVGEQGKDEVVRVRDQLLDDRVEAMLVGTAPGGDRGIGIGRDNGLLAERERELLALRRLDEERGLELR